MMTFREFLQLENHVFKQDKKYLSEDEALADKYIDYLRNNPNNQYSVDPDLQIVYYLDPRTRKPVVDRNTQRPHVVPEDEIETLAKRWAWKQRNVADAQIDFYLKHNLVPDVQTPTGQPTNMGRGSVAPKSEVPKPMDRITGSQWERDNERWFK